MPPADEQREAPESVMALQEGQWRAGVNRQSQPAAQAHQVAASHAAALKRKATAMSDAERLAKDKKRKAELREARAAAKDTAAEKERKAREAERRKQKRAEQKAAREAAAEAANQLTLSKFNTLMLFFRSVTEADWDPMDADEWDAFCEWLDWKQQPAAEEFEEFDSSTCTGFYEAWCDSPDYERYQMELQYQTVLGDNDTTFNEHKGPDECACRDQTCDTSAHS